MLRMQILEVIVLPTSLPITLIKIILSATTEPNYYASYLADKSYEYCCHYLAAFCHQLTHLQSAPTPYLIVRSMRAQTATLRNVTITHQMDEDVQLLQISSSAELIRAFLASDSTTDLHITIVNNITLRTVRILNSTPH